MDAKAAKGCKKWLKNTREQCRLLLKHGIFSAFFLQAVKFFIGSIGLRPLQPIKPKMATKRLNLLYSEAYI